VSIRRLLGIWPSLRSSFRLEPAGMRNVYRAVLWAVKAKIPRPHQRGPRRLGRLVVCSSGESDGDSPGPAIRKPGGLPKRGVGDPPWARILL
jgi:hypothetical protein